MAKIKTKNTVKFTAPEKIKPFVIKNYRFHPCVYPQSLKEGYIYSLLIRHRKNDFPVSEIYSPRFKTKKEAENYVNNNDLVGFKIG
jgi:hypothetical protein